MAHGGKLTPARVFDCFTDSGARERWTLLDDDCVMTVQPDRQPKVINPDGRVEEIEPSA
jgi:uncharacterized protein YndB with AHSA1/START domain